MKKNVVQFRLFVVILAAVTALAFATPLVGAGLVSAAGETHYVSSAADLDRIGRGTVGPDSATWDLDDVYVQTADITFGPGDDFNGGIQIRAAVNVSGSTAAVTVEYWNGTAFVSATSGSVLLAGSQTPVNIAAGTAAIPSFDNTVNNAIAVYGTIGGQPTAVVVEIPEGVASVAVEESSNGNINPIAPNGFGGKYDGAGYKIIGPKVASYAPSGTVYSALFRWIGADAAGVIPGSPGPEVVLENITVEGGSSVGVSAASGSQIYAGGLVGRVKAATGTPINIRNCDVDSAVYAFGVTSSTPYVGGMIGVLLVTSTPGIVNISDCVHRSGNLLGATVVANSLSTVGGIAGYIEASAEQPLVESTRITISNSNNESDIWVRSYGALFVGGLTGQVFLKDPIENATRPMSLVVEDFTNKGDISAWSYAGLQYVAGVFGTSYNGASVTGGVEASFDRCLNYGNISGAVASGTYYSWVGGLFGYIAGDYHGNVYTWTVSDSFNVGEISAKALNGAARAGGIAATSYVFSVEDSFNAGDVHTDTQGQTFAGGIIGLIMKHTEISGSYNAGDVYAAGINYAAAGGFVGYANWDSDSDLASGTQLVIENGYNSGNINAASTVDAASGGALGLIDTRNQTWNYVTIDKFYNIGSIDAAASAYDIGAIAGTIAGTGGGATASAFTDVYFLDDLTASYGSANAGALAAANYADPGAGQKTAAELNTAATFAGWDLTSVWGIYEDSPGATYSGLKTPYLKTTGNSVLVTAPSSSGATAAANPAYSTGSNYRAADPLTGTLGYSGVALGVAPTAPGTYAIVPGTLGSADQHYYQLTLLLGSFQLNGPTSSPSATWIIHASSDAGSNITPSGDVRIAEGGIKRFDFSAIAGYQIKGVSVDGAPLSAGDIANGSYLFINVTSDRTISVTSSPTGDTVPVVDPPQVTDDGPAAWSVLNLICAVIALAAGIVSVVALRGGKNDERGRASRLLSIASLIFGIIAAAVFLLTEDLSLSVDAWDGWTPLMILLLLLVVVTALAGAFKGRR